MNEESKKRWSEVRRLSRELVLVWAGLYYVTTLGGEALWLGRALQRDARRLALGELAVSPGSAGGGELG